MKTLKICPMNRTKPKKELEYEELKLFLKDQNLVVLISVSKDNSR